MKNALLFQYIEVSHLKKNFTREIWDL